ncbi:hypothetical protein P691DRAFT_687251 [Macrolepiota fuliginosa MF-IS2]|uniref:Nephrocystin 3-like N-terminal domain-containing protein n=1 Tax=Macrolepiota fuliginosa MF-IS2 TaxID=1400762 RepID=A0A9P5WZ33_9AGAR|nr:hypothetical protein P691DRAFT_687251 [Macrolepiota fuliginosa MF-IS2]
MILPLGVNPSQCHPDTRKSLRGRIIQWGMNDGSSERMFWVLGPPAVGKSAIAQTIAKEFNEKERLGASFFFSRPNHLNDPDQVIPTPVCQLATKSLRYRYIVTKRLVEDPLVLDKNRHVQFKKLIIEPFRKLMTEYPQILHEPLLILLGGLDECKDKQAQCEPTDLISTHVRQADKFPLRWIIFSHPEWYRSGAARQVPDSI